MVRLKVCPNILSENKHIRHRYEPNEELKQKFSVANIPLHGESLIIPNSKFKPDWADELESAGYKVFSGEYRGEVAWVIPLNRKNLIIAAVD